MKGMRTRRSFFALGVFALAAPLGKAAETTETIDGKLIIRGASPATLETADHKVIALDGDQPTRKVLHDDRLNGMDVHAAGHFTAPGKFLIDPQHKRAL